MKPSETGALLQPFSDKRGRQRACLSTLARNFSKIGSILLFATTSLYCQKPRNESEPIIAILQRNCGRETLSSRYFAELLALSVDHPICVKEFDLVKAEQKLRSSPVMQTASLSLHRQGTLVIDYEARQPIALLHDFVNIAIDAERVPFPLYPFYSPKNLPEMVLGEQPKLEWNKPLTNKKIELAMTLFHHVKELPFSVKRIDVGDAFAPSCGKRQIVLVIEELITSWYEGQPLICVIPRILRLRSKEYLEDLQNYQIFREQAGTNIDINKVACTKEVVRLPLQIFDFRVPNVAFIK
jgi:hypothetical protein